MWDILRFLKNPEAGAGDEKVSLDAQSEKNQIDARLTGALEAAGKKPSALSPPALPDVKAGESEELSAGESEFLIVDIENAETSAGAFSEPRRPATTEVLGDGGPHLAPPPTPKPHRSPREAKSAAPSLPSAAPASISSIKETASLFGAMRENEITDLSGSIMELGVLVTALESLAENRADRPPEKKRESADGPAGGLLGDLSILMNRHQKAGIPAQWRVKQMNQSALIVEISVDLMSAERGRSVDGE
jgi:hypothetical protein